MIMAEATIPATSTIPRQFSLRAVFTGFAIIGLLLTLTLPPYGLRGPLAFLGLLAYFLATNPRLSPLGRCIWFALYAVGLAGCAFVELPPSFPRMVAWGPLALLAIFIPRDHAPSKYGKSFARNLLVMLAVPFAAYGAGQIMANYWARLAYAKTVAEIHIAEQEGRVHLLNVKTHPTMCCTPPDPHSRYWAESWAHSDALRDHLPPHTGDDKYALAQLQPRGINVVEPANSTLISISFTARNLVDSELEHLIPVVLNSSYYTDRQQAHVDLSGQAGVTDAGVKYLRHIHMLTMLDLRGTSMSAEGVQKLRQALPRCEVVWQPQESAEASSH